MKEVMFKYQPEADPIYRYIHDPEHQHRPHVAMFRAFEAAMLASGYPAGDFPYLGLAATDPRNQIHWEEFTRGCDPNGGMLRAVRQTIQCISSGAR